MKPETVNAYEVGYKYQAGALSFDASTFYYDYKDLQVSTYFGTTAEISNAASSKIYGVDLQLRYKFVNGFQVSLGSTPTKAQYKSSHKRTHLRELRRGLRRILCGSAGERHR